MQPELRLVSTEYDPDLSDWDDRCLVEGLRRGALVVRTHHARMMRQFLEVAHHLQASLPPP